MKQRQRAEQLLYALGAVLLVGFASVGVAEGSDSRAKVISAELHRSADRDRVALLLEVRNFRSGHGEFVRVSHGDIFDAHEASAQRVKGSYRSWRVGANTKDGGSLLAELQRVLERKGVVRVDAGVPATAPSDGKISHFRIKAFNKPAPALGALPS